MRTLQLHLTTTPLRLAYLVSQYPAVNHTFILREIRKLRTLGCDIQVVSVRGPDRPPAKLGADELEEYQKTLTIFEAGASAIVGAHLENSAESPGRIFRGVAVCSKEGWLGLAENRPQPDVFRRSGSGGFLDLEAGNDARALAFCVDAGAFYGARFSDYILGDYPRTG